MNDYTTIALASKMKTLSEKAKKIITPGEYSVDELITLRVLGVVKRSKDTSYTPTAKIPLKLAMALLLEKCGVTREHSARMLSEAMLEALEMGEQANDAIATRLNDIEVAEKRVQELLNNLPKENKKGSCRVEAIIEEIEIPVLASA